MSGYRKVNESEWSAQALNGQLPAETTIEVPEGTTRSGPFDGPPRGKTCQRCSERPADEWWTGEGGALAVTHGLYQAWCWKCIYTVQLVYARRAAATIPDLERKLAEIERSR